MSIEENSPETEVSAEAQAAPVAQEAAPEAAPVEEATSSKPDFAALLSSVLALKESNPKVFYGGVGGFVLLILVIMMSGGSDDKLPKHQSKAVVVGQSYTLHSANAYDQAATVRLVSVPGSMAAYDDTEEADREGCKHPANGTPVKVMNAQDAYGKKDAFVEVEITGGECESHRGWTLSINLQ
jgi:hypothetical protein